MCHEFYVGALDGDSIPRRTKACSIPLVSAQFTYDCILCIGLIWNKLCMFSFGMVRASGQNQIVMEQPQIEGPLRKCSSTTTSMRKSSTSTNGTRCWAGNK